MVETTQHNPEILSEKPITSPDMLKRMEESGLLRVIDSSKGQVLPLGRKQNINYRGHNFKVVWHYTLDYAQVYLIINMI